MTLTTVADAAAVIARAVGYDGKWPTTGGICGNKVSISQILEIGNNVRGMNSSAFQYRKEVLVYSHDNYVGRPFAVEKVKAEDLEAGELNASWSLEAVHQAVPDDQAQALLKMVCIGTLLSSSKGAWNSSDEMNLLFPEYEFTPVEEFLSRVWEGKP